jgi:hypothetical protein
MKPVPLAAAPLNVIGTVRRKSLEKTAIVKMTGTESASENASEREKGNVRENAIERTARRVGVEAKGKGITNAGAHLHHLAMRGEITEEVVGETIQNFIKLILLVNNGQKMPPKIKILARMINILQLL